MTLSVLVLALIITWLPCWVILSRRIPTGPTGRQSLLAGYSLLLGLVTVPVLMRLLSLLGIEFSLLSIGLAAGLLLAIGAFLPASGVVAASDLPMRNSDERLQLWQTVLIGVCLALIGARLLSLGMELATRPLFAWDGKQHWAKQAKVFFDAGAVVPFVSLQEWLEASGSGVFTNMHPDYPITTPLLQTWVSVALGEWDESLISLPWLLCYVAIGLVFYGQLRCAGASLATSITMCYLLLSLPYLNTQVALAGYADLFLGACYLAAVAAFVAWSRTRVRWQGLLALVFSAAGLLIKDEGSYWLLTFIPGLIFALLPPRHGWLLAGVLAMALGLLYWMMPPDLQLAGHSLESLHPGYRPEGWHPLYVSFFVHDNWHLLGYLFAGLLACVALLARKSLPSLLPMLAVIFSALGLYLTLYLYTRHSYGAVNYTSLNRVALQLVPAIAFAVAVLYLQLADGGSDRVPDRGQPGETAAPSIG